MAEVGKIKRKSVKQPMTTQYFRDRSDEDPKTGCWNWKMAFRPGGYGAVRIGGSTRSAHRVSLMVATGMNPPSDVDACHKCDNRACVNPDHLFFGTRAENMQDCAAKGRVRVPMLAGEALTQSKLTEADVLQIRSLSGVSLREIARRYGVDRRTIAFVIKRVTWRHV